MSYASLLTAIGDFFLPQRCLFCGDFGLENGHVPLCEACRQKFIPIVPPFCLRCGTPFDGLGGRLCGECLQTPPPFEWGRSLFIFEGKSRELIHHLKFGKNLSTITLLTFFLEKDEELASMPETDMVIPVPQTSRGLRARGFNPAQMLASCVSKRIKKPMNSGNLEKIKETLPQIGLTKNQRRDNLRGAFALKDPSQFMGKTVLLVDDVYTTGATARACAQVLIAAGAQAVRVWTFARAVLR